MAKASENRRRVHLRLNCLNPPTFAASDSLEFGLQDKDRAVYPGEAQPDGSLRFDCELDAAPTEDGMTNFFGAFAHGTPQDRFLYLTWKNKTDQAIIQRIKIKLAAVSWAQVEAALRQGRLEATIEATRTGSVPLLGGGWQVTP